jgi:hypothetical protein
MQSTFWRGGAVVTVLLHPSAPPLDPVEPLLLVHLM